MLDIVLFRYNNIAVSIECSQLHRYMFIVCLICAASKIGALQLTDAHKYLVDKVAGQAPTQKDNIQVSGSQMIMQRFLGKILLQQKHQIFSREFVLSRVLCLLAKHAELVMLVEQ